MSIEQDFHSQHFANGYQLVDGVEMHARNGDQFQIPHDVLKKYIIEGFFVELRIDSPRFSVHPDAPEKCDCPSCNGEMTKPILSHEQPATLLPLPPQDVPSRGWGEDFWARITERDGEFCRAVVDNPLYETRLHKLCQGDEIVIHINHVLAIHPTHRQEMVLNMGEADLKQLVRWLGSL